MYLSSEDVKLLVDQRFPDLHVNNHPVEHLPHLSQLRLLQLTQAGEMFNRIVVDMQAREALVDEEFNILGAQVHL